MAQPPAPRLISVHAAVQEYVDGLERKTRKSPHTITAYSRDLNEFVRLLNDVGITADASLDDVEADHVDAVFVAYETQRDQRARTAPAPRHSAATVKRFRAAVSAFFRNADELNLVQISPMVHSQFQPRDSPDAGLAPWRKAMDADAAQRLLDVTLTGIPTQRPPGANVPDLRLRDHLM
ncbi:MAG: site-specific integrase, partial [Actinomycetes bacterium]